MKWTKTGPRLKWAPMLYPSQVFQPQCQTHFHLDSADQAVYVRGLEEPFRPISMDYSNKKKKQLFKGHFQI